MISDVTGDDPTHIASGPCVADPTTYRGRARDPRALRRHAAGLRGARICESGARGRIAETPKPGDATFARAENRVIATAHASLMAAAAFVQHRGVTPMVLGDSVTGEAAEVAKVYAALARAGPRGTRSRCKPPVALISGGETTVTLRGKGRGGRCSGIPAVARHRARRRSRETWALACDTDGIDGSEDNAGAILTPDALERARAARAVAPRRCLRTTTATDSSRALGDLVVTGPTRTNVNDYRVILVR